jgi:hypothetical protein
LTRRRAQPIQYISAVLTPARFLTDPHMPKTRVFQFKCCDASRNELVVAPMMATREAIESGAA